MNAGIKVGDIMTRNFISVSPDTSLIDCAREMIKKRVGSLILKNENKLFGIITEKDMLTKVMAKNLDIKKVPVEKVMSKKPISVGSEEDLYDAMILMSREEIRRLPVVDRGELVGLLTYKDILSIQPDLYDLFISQFNIRESERKSMLNGSLEGSCQSCGSYGALEKQGRKLSAELEEIKELFFCRRILQT